MWLRPSHLQQSLVEAVDVKFICICHHLLTVDPPASVGSHLGIYTSFPKARSTEVAVGGGGGGDDRRHSGYPPVAAFPASSFSPH